MSKFERRLTDDIIQHAINRIGQVLSDSVDILPDEEAVLRLYAMMFVHALASLNRGLGETQPLYGKLATVQRVGILSSLAGHAIAPDETLPELPEITLQYLSDSKAASREIGHLFNFKVIFEDVPE
jgi:hypothetical protein